jgi:hypothetical protein
MRKSRFTEEPMIAALKGARGGDAGEGALSAVGSVRAKGEGD